MEKKTYSDTSFLSEELKAQEQFEAERLKPTIKYFKVSFAFFLIADLITLGVFKFIWIHNTWLSIKKADKSDISPFWRSVFGIFFINELFEEIAKSAKSENYAKSIYCNLYANAYIVMVVLAKVISFIDKFLAATLLVTAELEGARLLLIWIFIFFKDLMFYSSIEAIKFYDKKIKQKEILLLNIQAAPKVTYFTIPTTEFLIFNLLTLGLYSWYWLYRNWKAIKQVEQSNISAFWRSTFSILFCHQLFERVEKSLEKHASEKEFSASHLSCWYILLSLTMVLSFINLFILIKVQKAMNFNNKKLLEAEYLS